MILNFVYSTQQTPFSALAPMQTLEQPCVFSALFSYIKQTRTASVELPHEGEDSEKAASKRYNQALGIFPLEPRSPDSVSPSLSLPLQENCALGSTSCHSTDAEVAQPPPGLAGDPSVPERDPSVLFPSDHGCLASRRPMKDSLWSSHQHAILSRYCALLCSDTVRDGGH